MKKLVLISFVLEFCALLLFYGYAYPIVPFWGDDFQHMSLYPTLSFVANSWIPSRLLPQYLQTNITNLGAYVIAPLSHLDFLDSVSFAAALVLSSAFVGVHILLYICAFRLTWHRSQSLLLSSIFLLGCIALAKPHMMPLLLPADLNAQGMGYLLTMVCFYTLPYLINLALVVALITLLLTQQSFVSFRCVIGGGR